ncbi:PF02656 domain protein [Aspergillus sclerotiicarbonarius CBS 121057]|uniref:PF02656 domain protein n=1 Tax=Aspergillus sclerotiicarbonarius (strain CBS 121057 / IBT 28362) TaxID=1448318 RepID=A0A319EGN5_ASPSB|nr:PF02656 domain protein [Aspergillus sclerotiicarbonarius CBS 121057]
MDSSDLTAPYARQANASSPTHRSSSPHSSHNEPRRMSPLSAKRQTAAVPDQHQSQPVNEATPIVSNSDTSRRNYHSTDGLRNRDSGSVNGHPNNTARQASRDPDQQNSQPDSEEHRGSWYGRIADRYGSLELENKGSVARDHLALERTFLAWLRTSLAFASIGIAVTQLFRLNSAGSNANSADFTSSGFSPVYDPTAIRITSASSRLRSIGKPLGTTFIGVAIFILLIGFHRYFESQYWIIRGKFPASRGSVALTAIVAASLIITALVVILAISPGAVEA